MCLVKNWERHKASFISNHNVGARYWKSSRLIGWEKYKHKMKLNPFYLNFFNINNLVIIVKVKKVVHEQKNKIKIKVKLNKR